MRRGAIIGFGEVARHGHWPAYATSSEVEIVAVIDPSEERRALARAAIPKAAVVSSFEELADEAAIDFVDICVPPALHSEQILAALQRGCDVLCEKPLLLELEEFESVQRAVEEAKRVVVPVHNWKYAPLVRRATELVRAGAIGAVRRVEIEVLRFQASVAADAEAPNWRHDRALAGGGILMDHGWHAVYLAHHFFGERPTAVRASLQRARADEVEEEARVTLDFPGGTAEIFLTWRAETRRNRIRIAGDRGEMLLDDDALKIGDESIAFTPALSAGSHHADWFEAMLPDVLESFRRPELARAAFAEAALCLSVIRRAYEQ